MNSIANVYFHLQCVRNKNAICCDGARLEASEFVDATVEKDELTEAVSILQCNSVR